MGISGRSEVQAHNMRKLTAAESQPPEAYECVCAPPLVYVGNFTTMPPALGRCRQRSCAIRR